MECIVTAQAKAAVLTVVIVHGGGKAISHAIKASGHEPAFVEVANLDPDKQVALKTHEDTCMGIDHDLYQQRIYAAAKSAETRKLALETKCRALLK